MSKRENDVNNIFRPSDSPLTENAKEQIAVRKNLERLRAERLAREVANAGHSPKQKTAGVNDGPFDDMLLGLMRSTLPI